jgi:predicted ribonuclease toxin of YeeF-YezG toxin-antitoxin module
MYKAFSEGREFKTQDIINEIDNSIPLAKLQQESVQKLQAWARSGKIRLGSIDTPSTNKEN